MPDNWWYCGIDPGLSGAICVLDPIAKAATFYDIPTISAAGGRKLDFLALSNVIQEAYGEHRIVRTVLEQAQAMPKQGVVSMFNYGVVYGAIQGLLATESEEPVLVRPANWKRLLFGKGYEKGKLTSVDYIRKLYPGINLMRTARSKRPDHNRADAACLACYAFNLS